MSRPMSRSGCSTKCMKNYKKGGEHPETATEWREIETKNEPGMYALYEETRITTFVKAQGLKWLGHTNKWNGSTQKTHQKKEKEKIESEIDGNGRKRSEAGECCGLEKRSNEWKTMQKYF